MHPCPHIARTFFILFPLHTLANHAHSRQDSLVLGTSQITIEDKNMMMQCVFLITMYEPRDQGGDKQKARMTARNPAEAKRAPECADRTTSKVGGCYSMNGRLTENQHDHASLNTYMYQKRN